MVLHKFLLFKLGYCSACRIQEDSAYQYEGPSRSKDARSDARYFQTELPKMKGSAPQILSIRIALCVRFREMVHANIKVKEKIVLQGMFCSNIWISCSDC